MNKWQEERINLRLSPELLAELDALARTLNLNRSQCVRFLLWNTIPGLPESWVNFGYYHSEPGKPGEYKDATLMKKRLKKFLRERKRSIGKTNLPAKR